MTAVECTGLTLGYSNGAPVLANVDLSVTEGEVFALLGPSGSGKTTLIHAVAGFMTPAAGQIALAGAVVSTPQRCLPPERRNVGIVFQHYALWPHMTAVDTVAYPLRRAGIGRRAARDRARELLDRVGVGALAERKPAELSGGQQQRIGLARALAREPAVHLFDEPSAHLDAHLRAAVIDELARQRAASGSAALYATHDPTEALSVADRVAVLHSGRLAQVAPPAQVYAQPADATVARLTGHASLLTLSVRATGPKVVAVTIGDVTATVACDNAVAAAPSSTVLDAARGNGGTTILVRPDWATLGGRFAGTVAAVRFHGPHTDHHLDTPAGVVIVRAAGPAKVAAGDRVTWSLRRCWLV
jgi:ABC-type Fe3+/spermidine/putrescine transport system ATPase subunit